MFSVWCLTGLCLYIPVDSHTFTALVTHLAILFSKQEIANQNGISVAILEVDSSENRDEKQDKEKEEHTDSNKQEE